MKLVDILARELKVWPEDLPHAMLIQSERGSVNYVINNRLKWAMPTSPELAEDWLTAIVTRAEWQAAVDALNAEKCEHSYANKIGCPECGELNSPKVVEWDGVGLPPVGLDVEIKRGNCTWIDGDEWQIGKTATVMASFLNSRDIEMASVQFPGGHCECILARCLSPIRTAEQVAAEEREKAVFEIAHILIDNRHDSAEYHQAGRIYDAGYRKEKKQCGS